MCCTRSRKVLARGRGSRQGFGGPKGIHPHPSPSPVEGRDSGGNPLAPFSKGGNHDVVEEGGQGFGFVESKHRARPRPGSRPFVKRVSEPVDSYEKGSGLPQRGRPSGRPWEYLADWVSTPVNVVPSFLASITPTALPST